MTRLHPAVYALLLGCCVLLGQFSPARADLIGYWPMDEGTGDDVIDQSGNGLDGLIVGAPDWVPGVFGGGIQFNGDGDHVEVANDEILQFTTEDSFTAMAWVLIPEEAGSGWRGIVTKSRDQLPGHWGIWINPQNNWVYGVSGNHLQLGQIEEGWHHLAISQDTEEAIQYLYLDGEVLGEYEGLDAQDGAGDLWFGGAKSVNEWFIGTVDEVRVYNEALSLDELLVIMAGPAIPGDFDASGALDAADIDDLTGQSASGLNNLDYDLTADALVNSSDVDTWVKDLFNSWIGDANLDLEFNSTDLVAVLASGTYEADVAAVWSTGDFNGDGRTDSSDLVAALADGGYEQGPRAAVSAVPEPSASLLFSMAFVVVMSHWRRPRGSA